MYLQRKRDEIDATDNKIVELLGKRKRIVMEILDFKNNNNIKKTDIMREKQIIDNMKKLSSENNIDPDFIKDLFSLILKRMNKQSK